MRILGGWGCVVLDGLMEGGMGEKEEIKMKRLIFFGGGVKGRR